MNGQCVTLPGGFIDRAGGIHREVELTPLTGREEELLATSWRPETASLVTTVLSRCVGRIGTIRPVTKDLARELLIADRQFLLLKLREATFGDSVRSSIPCPWPDCGERVSVHFSTGDVPVKESQDKGPSYTMSLSLEAAPADAAGEPVRDISFRLPNGGDQEAISPLLAENEAQALSLLLGRCVQRIGTQPHPDAAAIDRLSPRARMEIERQMEQVAPAVELVMEARCPECGRSFAAPFDLHHFFFGELRISRDLLYREVHYLAYHYHWSEHEILTMPRDKRRMYIDVLADEIEQINHVL